MLSKILSLFILFDFIVMRLNLIFAYWSLSIALDIDTTDQIIHYGNNSLSFDHSPYAFSTHGSANTSFIIGPIASIIVKLQDLEGSLIQFREGHGFGHVVAGRAHNLLELIVTAGCQWSLLL
jgi:hypothetical protein